MSTGKARLAILISGNGRNLQSILEACADGRLDAEPVLVISNKPQAYGLLRAEKFGVATAVVNHKDYDGREQFDQALGDCLAQAKPDVVALAGFMRILTPVFISRFSDRMLNIHPSLLPKYRGLNTHQRAIEAGDAEHGASIHYVTEELDGGPVVLQGKIPIRPEDDESSLANRIMEEVELPAFPTALNWVAQGRLRLHEGQAHLDGKPLKQAVMLDEI